MKISIEGCRRPMYYMWFLDGFQVYKVDREHAIRFIKKDLPCLTGNPLGEGERYQGYVIINYGSGYVEVGYLKGKLSRATKVDLIKVPRNTPEHLKKGWAYIVKGECFALQTFADCEFNIPYSGEDKQCFVDNLREKLVNMQLNPNLSKIITGFEADILDYYFGKGCWKKFFIEE